jgi:putative transposase
VICKWLIRLKLWKEAFWSRSFFLATTGGVSLDILKEYVENQGKNNR